MYNHIFYDNRNPIPRQGNSRNIAAAGAAAIHASSLAEGLAVGALIHSGVRLVGTHQDAVQRAVVGLVAVVSAGLDSALDALVGMTVHGVSSLSI